MKRSATLAAICAAAAIAITAYGQPAHGNHAVMQALKDNDAQWNRDFQSKNVDKLLAHYAADAVLMAPGMPASKGKDAIRKVLAEMVGDAGLMLEFVPERVDVSKSGDMAFTQGSYKMSMTDPGSKQVIHDHGSYVTTYRKEPDGSWKAVADIATSEMPMGGSK